MTVCERFMRYVRKSDDCWLWSGKIATNGYGHFWTGERDTGAHRASYALWVGPIPTGHFVLHRCDVRACVRPDHLFTGTATDNMRDCSRKGRTPAKLTPDGVREIRRLVDAGFSYRTIGRQFGVNSSTVARIMSGGLWAFVEDMPNRAAR